MSSDTDDWKLDLRVPLTDLRRRLRARRSVELSLSVGGLRVSDTEVDRSVPVEIGVTLESLPEGVMVSGHISAGWLGPCNLCLDNVTGPLEVDVRELYADKPTDDDTYRLHREYVDLWPLVSDALQLELPLLAKCPNGGMGVCASAPELPVVDPATSLESRQDGSAGTRPEDGVDPRWKALDDLTFD